MQRKVAAELPHFLVANSEQEKTRSPERVTHMKMELERGGSIASYISKKKPIMLIMQDGLWKQALP